MIKNYFTDKTEIIEIESKELIQYKKDEEEKLELLAQQISKETNVPITSIYTGKYNCRIGNWHKIDGKYYYFKPRRDDFDFFNELIGEFISMYFDLDTVHYKIAKLSIQGEKDQYGIISENFCEKEYTYKSLRNYISEIDKLLIYEPIYNLLDQIKSICKTDEEFELLQDDLKKLIIRHYYNTQRDGGNGQNIMLKKNQNGIRLATLYDYEDAYFNYENMHRCFWNIGEFNILDENTQNLLRNNPRFQELLCKLMDADISSFITQVEDIHKVLMPKRRKAHYQKYEAKVKKLVIENNLIK